MKVAAVAALGVLIMLPGEAAKLIANMLCRWPPPATTMVTVPSRYGEPSPGYRRVGRKPKTSATAQDRSRAIDANATADVVISSKTVRARVGIAYAARFQAYIDDLENNHGARVLFMGGIRPGRCSISSEHPCGKALDVCQLRRGVVDRRCNLPNRVALGQIAASHGLFEGGRWCDSDYGHAQIGVTAAACGDRRTRIVEQQNSASSPAF